MLGHFRFLLALMVIVFHLGGTETCSHWGVYAVFGFYVISGYLMTMVLNSRYGFNLRGGARYLANRALRLYPPYLCVCGLALVLLAIWGQRLGRYHPAIHVPASLNQWFGNLLIVPFVGDNPVRLVPPAWSLAVELVFYFLLWLFIARSRSTALFGLLVSLGWTAKLIAVGADFSLRYYTVSASALPFCLGAGTYYVKDELRRRLPALVQLTLPLLFIANVLTARFWHADVLLWPFYLNVLLAGLSVVVLADGQRFRPGIWDQWLGSLSYPMFLCHWHAGFLAYRLVRGPSHSLAILFVALPIALAFSFLLCRFVEQPVARLRERIKRPQPAPEEAMAVVEPRRAAA
jgi:peptidoglycan/LPS O-acetylase OafA/YrhL